ncbi:MAG: hypothetical protein M5R40_21245 [Anaerolineae bacterium]|nr:hypothetical protein [Anaerolineae bacterium]
MSKPLERTWVLRESPFDVQHYTRNESLFAIGNGYVGVRGTFEEGYPGDLATTYVHGVFDHAEGEQVPELVNAPNWLNLTIAANGAPFGIDTGFLLGYERTLDLYRGVLTRRALWQSGSGGPVLRFAFERFASRARQHVMALRARVTALDQDVALTVEARLDGNVSNEGVRHWGPWQQGGDPTGPAWLLGETMQSGYALGMAAAFENDAGVAPEYVDAAGSPTVRLAFDLKKGATVTFTRLVALHTSRDVAQAQVLPDDAGDAARRCRRRL